MDKNEISRLFISKYSPDGCQWIADGKNQLHNTDMVLLFHLGLAEPNQRAVLMINNMIAEGQAKRLDVQALINNRGNEDLNNYIMQCIRQNSNPDTVVVFMKWPDAYYALEDQLGEVVKQYVETKSVKNINALLKERKIKTEHIQNKNVSRNEAMDAETAAMAETFKGMDDISMGVEAIKSQEPNNKHPPKYPDYDELRREWEREREEREREYERHRHKPDRHDFRHDEPDTHGTPPKGPVKGPVFKSKSQKKVEPEQEKSLDEILDQIFQDPGEGKKPQLQQSMSELSMAKAQYIDLLFERLVNGIKKYIDGEKKEDLTRQQFLSFVMLLLQAKDFDDFDSSWNVAGDRNFPIVMTPDIFTYLREEAEYYSNACKLVYEDDKWNN